MIMLIDNVMEVLTIAPSKRHSPKLKTENHWFIQQKIKQEQIRLSPVILVFLNSDCDGLIPRIKRYVIWVVTSLVLSLKKVSN